MRYEEEKDGQLKMVFDEDDEKEQAKFDAYMKLAKHCHYGLDTEPEEAKLTYDELLGVCVRLLKKLNKLEEENTELQNTNYVLADNLNTLIAQINFLKLNNPEQNIEHFRVVGENQRKIKNLRYANKDAKRTLNTLKHRLNMANEYIEMRKDNMIPEHYDDLKYIINECGLNSSW